MKQTMLTKLMVVMLLTGLVLPYGVFAQEAETTAVEVTVEEENPNEEVTEEDLGATEEEVNEATQEESVEEEINGMLIEIGNTTAENTTLIVRTTDENGETVDETVQIDTESEALNEVGEDSDLSDWIAGDQLRLKVKRLKNSDEISAKEIRNRSFKKNFKGRNGWVKAVRPELNEMDVEWAGKLYTLNTENSRMVAGLKNPAALTDFQVDDRIRARVKEDGDGNELTWDANIIVVLRRGEDLFMRVTRWVVPAEITMIPEDLTKPMTIEVSVLPSKFFEEGDVNNLVGEPGSQLFVEISPETKIVRRYLGNAELRELAEGDHIKVVGRMDEATGHVKAEVIKNNSIQKAGVANKMGTVTAINGDEVTVSLETENGTKEWIVNLDEATNVFQRGDDETAEAGIEVGDQIRVRGVANRNEKEVDAEKVYVLPPKEKREEVKKEMRKKAKERKQDAKERGKKKIATLKTGAKEKLENRKELLQAKLEDRKKNIIEKVNEKRDSLKERLSQRKENTKERLEERKENVKDRLEERKENTKERLQERREKSQNRPPAPRPEESTDEITSTTEESTETVQ